MGQNNDTPTGDQATAADPTLFEVDPLQQGEIRLHSWMFYTSEAPILSLTDKDINTCLNTKPKYQKNRPVYGRIPVDSTPMQDLSIAIKTMSQAFGGYHLLLLITCDQTNFTIAISLRDRQTQMVAEALVYQVIYLFGPPRQIVCDEPTGFTSAIIQAILTVLNYTLKVIHGSSKYKRQIKTICEIIVKPPWDKGQMWPLFVTTTAYAMNTFASEAVSRFSPFQIVILRDPPDLTSLVYITIYY